jgi:hypothetical protein
VTGATNSLIKDGKSLTVNPENRVFGDPCSKHKPYIRGHHKNLELAYALQGNKLLTEYDKPHTLTLIEKWDDEIAVESRTANVEAYAHHQATPPTVGITLRNAVVEDYVPGLNYPRKLRLYLSNESNEVDLGKGKWIADGIGLQIGKPPTCEYETKDHLGKWIGEASFKRIPSGKWFRLYVGLDSTVEEQKIKAMAEGHSLGVLQIPARVDGADVLINIRP